MIFKVEARFSDVFVDAHDETQARAITMRLEDKISKLIYKETGKLPHPDSIQLDITER